MTKREKLNACTQAYRESEEKIYQKQKEEADIRYNAYQAELKKIFEKEEEA